MSNYNPVGWFEIYIQDMEKAKAFYSNVLATEMTDMGDPTDGSIEMSMFGTMDENGDSKFGSGGALVKMDGMPSGGNSTIVYFLSEDCSIEESRVAAAGGSVFKSKFSIGQYGYVSLCTDIDGNMFGLHSMK